ncbi:ribonuclease H-like domain-containing protein [Tanacetum coccineum]
MCCCANRKNLLHKPQECVVAQTARICCTNRKNMLHKPQESVAQTHDWYYRLGHPAEPVLNVLQESLQFDDKNQNVYCEICQRAKQTREPFPLSDHTSKFLGDILPNDDERVEPKLNSDQRSQSVNSSSSVFDKDANTADFPVNSGNDACCDRKVIGSKWIYKIKYRSSGEIDRYKARHVAQGFGQKEETVYMRPPEGYFPSENDFSQSKSDYSLYTKSDKGDFLALLVYVDDIIITCNNISEIEMFKVYLKSKFMIKDLGKLKYFLGIEVIDTDKGICLNKRKYVLDLLSEYGMLACKPAKTPLMSKLIISNEAFMHSPLKSHLKIAFKILRYLKICPGLGIHIIKTSGMSLSAYSDADWAKCVVTRRSVTGYCVFLNNSLVSWKSKKQNTLFKSSTEAEYRALALVTSEVIWILKILKDLNGENLLPVSLHRDSNYAIKIAANPVFHERTKYLENDLNFVREKILKGVIRTVKVESANQIADILTKGLDTLQHKLFVENLGMFDIYQFMSLRQGGASALVCKNCGINGHTIERCFKIIGYPVDLRKKNPGQNFKEKNVSNNNSVGTGLSYGFTYEQMATLISLIKDNKNRKNVQANMPLDESFSSRNHVKKFLRALPSKWRPKVMVIEESKDLSKLSLDELVGNLKVYEVVLEKDLESAKNKKEKYKSLALKARQVLSDEDASSSDSNNEEYAMAGRDFKNFFRRRGKFVRQPYDDKKNFRKVKEDKKEDQMCFKCGNPNHFISDCPKNSFNDQKAFVMGCWGSSLDNESRQNEYDKLCKISLRIINKNKHLKAKNELLKRNYNELKIKLELLEKNKDVSNKCDVCDKLENEINSLKLKLASFKNSSSSLQKMVEMQKPSKDKCGLGYTENIASSSNPKIKNLVSQIQKMPSVEPALPVPLTTEPASSNEQHRASVKSVENWESA